MSYPVRLIVRRGKSILSYCQRQVREASAGKALRCHRVGRNQSTSNYVPPDVVFRKAGAAGARRKCVVARSTTSRSPSRSRRPVSQFRFTLLNGLEYGCKKSFDLGYGFGKRDFLFRSHGLEEL